MKTEQPKFAPIPTRLFLAVALVVARAFSPATAGTITDANWTPVGSGMSATVLALAVSGPDLDAGGPLTDAGGGYYVARWGGRSWRPVGAGMNRAVRALAIRGNTLSRGGAVT